MTTKILPPDESAIEYAAHILKNGGLVAIPTETVYGLAANAYDPEAVSKIFAVKGRPQDNPLIVHISDFNMLSPLVSDIPEEARRLSEAFWPGPLAMVLFKSRAVPDIVSAGLDTVAVRMPSHPAALEVIIKSGLPLAAPSANRSGGPSPTTAAHCAQDLEGRIPLIIDGGDCKVGVESTVLTLAGKTPRILRPGAVTPDDIKGVLGGVRLDPSIFRHTESIDKPQSPGMKYSHYRPDAKVVILDGNWGDCLKYFTGAGPDTFGLVFEEELEGCPVPAVSLGKKDDATSHAKRLFAALRELDLKGAKLIYARAPKKDGLSLAVYNRMIRAAGFSVIEV
jgi:L-threonylcarbamoyladenylate synthase